MKSNWWQQYTGDRRNGTLRERGDSLRHWDEPPSLRDPSQFLASKELRAAVNVALVLQQPLLLTGAPGTGKTEAAGSVAWELGLPLFPFRAKTTSTATDLFYRYDAMRHFHASRFDPQARMDAQPFLEAEALGKAILLTRPEQTDPSRVDPLLPKELRGQDPQQSVVLIDEIDKAPRDFPNDLLEELRLRKFRIAETGEEFEARKGWWPVVIITSNAETNLPDAFLRRCVFHFLEPPDAGTLLDIVESRLGIEPGYEAMLKHAVEWFVETRDRGGFQKPPGTSELLDWAQLLKDQQIDIRNLQPGQAEIVLLSAGLLAKTKEDLEKLLPRLPKG